MKVKRLPTDPEELRQLYDKIKDREARLEADLAMRDCPALEDRIKELVLCLVELRKIKQQRYKREAEAPPGLERKKLQVLLNQLRFYGEKIALLKLTLDDLTSGAGSKWINLDQREAETRQQLQRLFEESRSLFQEHEVDLIQLIPSMGDFVTLPR
jgi:hypothetical protein